MILYIKVISLESLVLFIKLLRQTTIVVLRGRSTGNLPRSLYIKQFGVDLLRLEVIDVPSLTHCYLPHPQISQAHVNTAVPFCQISLAVCPPADLVTPALLITEYNALIPPISV